MMKLSTIILLQLFFLLLLSPYSFAQTDPMAFSYTSSNDALTNDDGMEKNRYVKRPKAKLVKRVPAQVPKADEDDDEDDDNNAIANSTPTKVQAGMVKSDGLNPDSKSLRTQAQDLVFGADLELLPKYRSFLDPQDVRRNYFEFSLAASYMYNDSRSPYFFRNYNDASPGIMLGIDLWLTPFFAIDGDYRSTLISELKDSPTADSFVSTTNTWYNLGFKFRRFFGLSPTASSLVFSLRYSDYSLSLSPNSVSRLRQHTRGPELGFAVSMPSTKTIVWNAGFILEPFIAHDESVFNSNDLRSGQSNQSVGIGAHIGGEYRMGRKTQLFFKFSTLIYKSQFSGTTLAVDPNSGQNPTNVRVTNAFYLFDLGFRLGR